MLPPLDSLSRSFKIEVEKEKVKKKKPEDFIKKNTVNKMRKVLKAQGLTPEQIDKQVERFGKESKKLDLKELEDMNA
jgi:hypothetical protein